MNRTCHCTTTTARTALVVALVIAMLAAGVALVSDDGEAASTHTVTFEAEYYETEPVEAVPSQTVPDGGLLTYPAEPKLPSQWVSKFCGWYTDPELTTKYEFSEPVHGSFTLYAKYSTDVRTVTFVSNGGSPVPSQTVSMYDSPFLPPDPVRPGYEFYGWYHDDGEFLMEADVTREVRDNYVYYADWADPDGYTVYYRVDGEVVHTETRKAGEYFETIPRYEMEGHKVGYWSSDDVFREGLGYIMRTRDAHFDATATPEEYTITYFTGFGAASIPEVTLRYGDRIVPPEDPVADGYVFTGWQPEIPETMPAEDLLIYAQFVPETQQICTVKFETNGGTAVEEETAYIGAVVREPETSRDGYVLAGWFTDPSFTDPFDFKTPVASNLTLYAKWLREGAEGTHRIAFETNGGDPIQPMYVAHGRLAKPVEATRVGYVFSHWCTDAELRNPFSFPFDPVTSDLTLYAVWKDVATVHIVTCYTSPGMMTPSVYEIDHGSTVHVGEMTYGGVKCTGWYTDPECTVPYDLSSPVTSDLTLYAGWPDRSWHSLTYMVDGVVVEGPYIIASGGEYLIEGRHYENGYPATDWTSAEVSHLVNRYHFIMPDMDVTFTATMMDSTHTVTFDSKGGNRAPRRRGRGRLDARARTLRAGARGAGIHRLVHRQLLHPEVRHVLQGDGGHDPVRGMGRGAGAGGAGARSANRPRIRDDRNRRPDGRRGDRRPGRRRRHDEEEGLSSKRLGRCRGPFPRKGPPDPEPSLRNRDPDCHP